MKFNFRKIASVIASAVMLGSTLGTALAANYPAPFVVGGAASGAIVITSGDHIGAVSDWDAAISLQTALQGLVTSTGGSTGASGTGGDSVNLASSSQRLYYNSTLNSARTTLTRSELPTLLADGTVTDDQGTAYTYQQSLVVGSSKVEYSTSGNDFSDPIMLVQGGYLSSAPLYNISVTFNKAINVTNTNVQGNDITILGKKFTIGASSTSDAGTPILYLYGAGSAVTMNEGEEKTITVSGVDHTVKVTGISQVSTTNHVYVSVDGGNIVDISTGSSSKVGGLNIYAKTVFYSAKESSQNYATLNIGAEKIKIVSGQTIYSGTDETSIQNTLATLTATAGVGLSGISVAVAMQDTTHDYIKVGESFKDPIFGGLKIQFADVVPSIEDTSRDSVVVDTDNARNARVAFTSALSGAGTLTFVHDVDTSDSTVSPKLADVANYSIHVIEGENVSLNEYMLVNSGDYGRILKLTSVPTGAMQTTSTIQFQDALSGTNIFTGSGLTVGSITAVAGNDGGNSTTNIDGQPYYFRVYNGSIGTNVSVTWGSGASYGTPGVVTTISPRIKLAGGEWIAILTGATLTNGTMYSLPGTDTLTTYEAGANASFAKNWSGNTTNATTLYVPWNFGNVNYTLKYSPTSGYAATLTATIEGINSDNTGSGNQTVSPVDCPVNSTYLGAILVIEGKKTTETNNADNGDVVCVYVKRSGTTTPVTVSASQPYISGIWSTLTSWTSNSYQQSGMTRQGTYIKYNSQNPTKTEVFYPNQQMFADVLFTADTTTVAPGVVSGGSILVIKDTEVSSVSDRNLVVVGGSCINTAAAKILGSDTPKCGADFTTLTGVDAGKYIIQAVASPYNAEKTAVLIAGYEAAETKLAAAKLKEGIATDVGTKTVYPQTTA